LEAIMTTLDNNRVPLCSWCDEIAAYRMADVGGGECHVDYACITHRRLYDGPYVHVNLLDEVIVHDALEGHREAL